jgi:hypothetical protein
MGDLKEQTDTVFEKIKPGKKVNMLNVTTLTRTLQKLQEEI